MPVHGGKDCSRSTLKGDSHHLRYLCDLSSLCSNVTSDLPGWSHHSQRQSSPPARHPSDTHSLCGPWYLPPTAECRSRGAGSSGQHSLQGPGQCLHTGHRMLSDPPLSSVSWAEYGAGISSRTNKKTKLSRMGEVQYHDQGRGLRGAELGFCLNTRPFPAESPCHLRIFTFQQSLGLATRLQKRP